ncbi:glutamate--cysteine ligase [Streptomyces sp. NPDC012888]|uniref:carboxylate-amine ligase n=1 Tax=Streptomyces sp. NPDC012888 TaxID=3364855 RepID=UPI0036C73587
MRALTMGVEEEFLLVDRRDGTPVERGPAVLRAARRELGDQVQAEFFTSQIEVGTEPASRTADLRAELVRLRRTLAGVAGEAGCRIAATGTPLLPPDRPLRVVDSARYQRMVRLYPRAVGRYDGMVCGCHVHLGTLDRATAVVLADHMRPWLPTLQAMAGNSPFAQGRDTGYSSWRSVEFARWPQVGPAPMLRSEATYERYADRLVDAGVLLDRKMIYWYARPSEHVPTLEIRVADVNADVDTVVLLAALVRGLGMTLLPEAERGDPPPEVPDRDMRQAHAWAAAHGLAGTGLDPLTGEEVPVLRLVDRLLDRAAPGLEAAGDLELAEELVRRLRTEGGGAARQRAVYRRRGDLRNVVNALAAATCRDG